jgi:translation elongation factor EF-4
VCLVAVVDGQLSAGDKLAAVSTGQQYDVLEVGGPVEGSAQQ